MLESGDNDAGFDDNPNIVVMGRYVHKVKNRKKNSKKMDECVNDFESGTTQSEAVIEGDVDRSVMEKAKDKKKKKFEEIFAWQTNQEEQDFAETMKGEKNYQRKKEQHKRDKEGDDVFVTDKVTNRDDKSGREQFDGNIMEKIELLGRRRGEKVRNTSLQWVM